MLPLNLLWYTAMSVFFQKWPKTAQLNILSLGVTTISMICTHFALSRSDAETSFDDKWILSLVLGTDFLNRFFHKNAKTEKWFFSLEKCIPTLDDVRY